MTMHVTALTVAAVALLGSGAAGAPPASSRPSPPSEPIVLPAFRAVNEQWLDVPVTSGVPIDVSVVLDGAPRTLHLEPHSLRADGFGVLVPDGAGSLKEVPAPPAATYRGSVDGLPGSRVAATVAGGAITAAVQLAPDGEVWWIQPLSALGGPAAGPGAHVVYRRSDLVPDDHRCGAGDIDQPFAEEAAAAGGAAAGEGDGMLVAELAVDADWQYFQQNDNSVDETVLDIETVLNANEIIYERDTAIAYEITAIVIRTSPGDNPYTTNDPASLLNEFSDVWNTFPEAYIFRDVAQLFTGRDMSGSVIGIAWVGVVCHDGVNGNAYSVVQSRWTDVLDYRAALTAHELGHTWGAAHCDGTGDCHIMCSYLNGCDGVDGPSLRFGPMSLDAIIPFRDSRDCLVPAQDPVAPPFRDAFTGVEFDPAKWTWTQKTEYSTEASHIPSPPNTMLLNAGSEEPYRDDEIRSNVILLGGASDLILSYECEHRGVEAGERLIVEYLGADGDWTNLDTVESDGVDQDYFEFRSMPLPPGAYHDGFRLRFRVEADALDDHWFVDDVYVGPVPPSCPADLDGNGSVGFADLVEVLSSWGPCSGCPADLDGPEGVPDGEVGFPDLLAVLSSWGDCG